jgi:[acyl-carrier-protein] S-malonyltransferase
MGYEVYQQFPCVHPVYEAISDTINADIAHIAFHGPDDLLQQTHHAQAALCATSIAFLTVLEQEFGCSPSQWAQVAGHSMGEYIALYAAKVLTLEQTILSIARRGQAMSRITNGCMGAILGLDHDAVHSVLLKGQEQGLWATLANDNHPTQKVIATWSHMWESWSSLFALAGAAKCIPLKVSGPFHSPPMQPAQDEFWSWLSQQTLGKPVLPVVSNVTAKPSSDIPSIRQALSMHMTHPVRWTETIQQTQECGIHTIVEIGAGKVLSALAKKTRPQVTVISINDKDSLVSWGQNHLIEGSSRLTA